MISFTLLTPESEREIVDRALAYIPEADANEILDIVSSFADCSFEVAFCSSCGCLLMRIFDGEYLFPYPVALTDTADALAAAEEIRLYSIREEILPTFIDVPSEECEGLLLLFSSAVAEDYDQERDSYTVRVNSEAALIDEIPQKSLDSLTLNSLNESDTFDYARLSRDEETNRYWGYDYREDNPLADGEYFLSNALMEFSRGTAIPLAVRLREKFVGEAIIYAFDLVGGAECAIRLLPEYRGKKIGDGALSLLILIARDIGLKRLYATVKNENEASIHLFSRKMEIAEKDTEKTRFYINL